MSWQCNWVDDVFGERKTQCVNLLLFTRHAVILINIRKVCSTICLKSGRFSEFTYISVLYRITHVLFNANEDKYKYEQS